MAKTYSGLQKQVNKVRTVFENLTPPQPDDEFEDLRRACYAQMDRMNAYISGRVTGDGSIQSPSEIET